MVALLVGLRWRQLGHQLGRNPWMIVTLIITGMMALSMLGLLTVGLFTLRVAAPESAVTVMVLAGAVIVLGWWVGSILVSTDDSLAPERFALLPVTARKLLPGLVVAGATTIGGIGTALALVVMLMGWSVSVPALIAGVLIAPLALATCVLGARVVSGLLAGWLARRRTRDLVVTIGVLLLASSGILLNLVLGAVSQVKDVGAAFTGVAEIVAWTPPAAAFGVPAALIQGDVVAAALRLLIALATVAVFWLISRALLAARLVAPIQSSGGGRVRSGGFVDRLLPATATGAIAGSTLRYYRRDPRQVINAVMMLLLPAIFVGLALMNGLRNSGAIGFHPAIVLIPSINALMAATIMQMAITYDNDAVALHILTGVRRHRQGGTRPRPLRDRLPPHGRAVHRDVRDRRTARSAPGQPRVRDRPAGRGDRRRRTSGQLPARTCAGPGGQSVRPRLVGRRAVAPRAPHHAPITLVLGGPALSLAVAALWNPMLGWISLLCDVVLGGIAIWGGVALGGHTLDGRWPEVLAEVSSEA